MLCNTMPKSGLRILILPRIIKRPPVSKIVSEEPSYGGKWYVTKILFINPSLVSVEYEDGHFIHESQIRIIRPKENFRFEEVK